MTKRDICLSAHPLTGSFYSTVLDVVSGHPEFLVLADLRRSGFGEMWRQLRKAKGRNLYIAVENTSAEILLPILKCAAAVSGAQKFFIVRASRDLEAFSYFSIFRSVFALLGALFAGGISAVLSYLQLKRLHRSERRILSASGTDVLYVKVNPWGGGKIGGAVAHVAGVVNGFTALGYRIYYASPEEPIGLNEKIKVFPLRPLSIFAIPAELNLYRLNHSVVKNLQKAIAGNINFSFIYQRLALGNYAGVVLSRLFNIPLVLEYNGSEVWISENWGNGLRFPTLARMAEATCLKHASLIVTISDVLKDDLIARGVEEQRIVTYPNCVDVDYFDPARFSSQQCRDLRAQYNIDEDAFVITFIGTFGQWHGIEIFAKAISHLVQYKKEWLQENKVRFLLIGDGVKRQEVEEIIKEAQELNLAVLTGLIDQDLAPLYLAASDAFASPHIKNSDGTKFFGSPTKLFEYLAMAKPVIASDLDQVSQVLAGNPRVGDPLEDESGACAILCPPGDAEKLAQAIVCVTESPRWANRAGKNARTLAQDKYTWKRHVEAIVKALPGD